MPLSLEILPRSFDLIAFDSGGTDDGGSGIVFPFPPAPPGFLIPAPGVPNPKGDDTCPADYTDTKCKDCEAKSGWCTEGPQMGCPCLDECPTGDDLPSCSDKDCDGEDDGKCTIVSNSRINGQIYRL